MLDFQSARRSRGFTLVELLVALALGLMLSAGIVNVYLQNKRNYMQDEEVARLQENARYTLGLLKRELTMTGLVAGIADYSDIAPGAVTTDCAGSDWALNVQGDMFELVNNVLNSNTTITTINGTTWTCLTASELQDGTDLLSVKRTADRPSLKNGSLATGVTEEGDKQWYLRAEDENSILSWSYLASGGSFLLEDATAGSGVDYWEYYSKIFHVRNYSRSANDGIPTLCVTKLAASAMSTECLVEGIEDLQIEVGIDKDEDSVPDRFTDAPSQAEMEDAVVIRVYVLVRSINPLSDYSNQKEYHLGRKTVRAKNDGFVRRVFSTTVQMRNAKLPNA